MQIKINKAAAVAGESGSKLINSSGIYPVTIDFASISVAASGAEQVNFNIDYNGNKQTIWGPWVTAKDGSTVESGANMLIKLGVIAGMSEGEQFDQETQTHAVGKDGKEQDFTVITQFTDLPVYMHVKEEYSRYQGNIRQALVPQAFFRASDKASAEEIMNDKPAGTRFAQTEEKYASNVSYKDGVTPEEVAEWKANGYGKGSKSNTATAAPKATTTARPNPFK
jgi:hypothetical protein